MHPSNQDHNVFLRNASLVPKYTSTPVSRTYMESFTIHGLSKVFLGKLWERFFWGLVLLAVLGFLAFKVHGFHSKYKRNEYRSEIREVDEINRTWPVIKVCSKTIKDEFFPSYVFSATSISIYLQTTKEKC